jgi:predicted methyltransferase
MSNMVGKAVAPFLVLVALTGPVGAGDDNQAKLQATIDGPQRSNQNRLRDVYRHPLETLSFFGLRDDQTVVEISPSTGWWTEILAPYLRDHGTYYAAVPDNKSASPEQRDHIRQFGAKLAGDPQVYDKVIVTEFASGKVKSAPPGSADLVLTFRNIHNWLANGTVDSAFRAFYRVLKPGGVLGVEEHRASPDRPQDRQAKSGYVREDVIIALAEKAGFRLAARSEINANPKDTKDYPAGVWTLPPTLRLKDQDRDRYLAIGESDRATLKFVKPK